MMLKYDGESCRHTFMDYVSKHIGAAATLKRLGEPIAELFHKQQFIKNITCDDLKVQVKFATSMIGEWDLDKSTAIFLLWSP